MLPVLNWPHSKASSWLHFTFKIFVNFQNLRSLDETDCTNSDNCALPYSLFRVKVHCAITLKQLSFFHSLKANKADPLSSGSPFFCLFLSSAHVCSHSSCAESLSQLSLPLWGQAELAGRGDGCISPGYNPSSRVWRSMRLTYSSFFPSLHTPNYTHLQTRERKRESYMGWYLFKI